ncbi:MAG: Folate-dependent protein for Fe/S cluster synthesis/repair in oxidative stress [Myxococcaceae bacterium]|nr:Folate-dependent protein for Fe/S cluster synthesis/repair in oxidative stress [Myxococcaceae bacterium]
MSSTPTSNSTQVRWLRERAGVYRTRDRVVHVRGEDARSWLNGQISNDVRTLAGDQARYAVALTVKGRIISDLWALEDAPGMAFVVPGVRAEAALARFDQYIIMEDVELELDDDLVVVTLQGPAAGELLEVVPEGVRRYACARLGNVGYDCWLSKAQLDDVFEALVARAAQREGGAIDDAAWAEAHVALGVPRVALDFGDDAYPQEAGLGARALSFGKGCYLGQEVVYMLENRGQLARRLVQLEVPREAAVAAGQAVVDAAGKRLGEVTSTASAPDGEHDLALAYVKRAFAEPESTVWVAGSPARVSMIVGSSASEPAA